MSHNQCNWKATWSQSCCQVISGATCCHFSPQWGSISGMLRTDSEDPKGFFFQLIIERHTSTGRRLLQAVHKRLSTSRTQPHPSISHQQTKSRQGEVQVLTHTYMSPCSHLIDPHPSSDTSLRIAYADCWCIIFKTGESSNGAALNFRWLATRCTASLSADTPRTNCGQANRWKNANCSQRTSATRKDYKYVRRMFRQVMRGMFARGRRGRRRMCISDVLRSED